MQKIVGIVFLVLCIGFLLFLAPFCWVFRDGMGPDSMTSSGYQAVGRFSFLFVIATAALSPVWGVALLLIKAGLEQPQQIQEQSETEVDVWPPPPTKRAL